MLVSQVSFPGILCCCVCVLDSPFISAEKPEGWFLSRNPLTLQEHIKNGNSILLFFFFFLLHTFCLLAQWAMLPLTNSCCPQHRNGLIFSKAGFLRCEKLSKCKMAQWCSDSAVVPLFKMKGKRVLYAWSSMSFAPWVLLSHLQIQKQWLLAWKNTTLHHFCRHPRANNGGIFARGSLQYKKWVDLQTFWLFFSFLSSPGHTGWKFAASVSNVRNNEVMRI